MKAIIIKVLPGLLMFLSVHSGVFGQTGRFGNTPEDSIRCLRNLSLYSDRHKQGNFEEALPYWRVVFREFPLASRNIYIWGQDLMSYMIQNAETEEVKRAYLDTAMMMFDQRIEYFGDKANILGRKGLFYLEHNNNIDEAEMAYETLAEAIRLSGNNPSTAVIVTYMNLTIGKFMAGLVDNEQVINTYSYLMEIIDNSLAESATDAMVQARDYVESMFADSRAADCNALINLFTHQVNNAPEDVDLLSKVNELLTNAACTDSDLYLTVTERLHVLDPSARSAINLSAMYRVRDNDEKVIEYLEEAIELQEDKYERANYLLELSIIANQVQNNKQLSRQYALQALENNPSLGRAHLHIGSLYAAETGCFEEDFEKRTVYWVAVDRFNEAKRVDPSISADANHLIEMYSVYFPDNESIFFHGYTVGDAYRVGCWINEPTRVRARK